MFYLIILHIPPTLHSTYTNYYVAEPNTNLFVHSTQVLD